MKPFLLELAEKIYQEYQRKIDTLTIIFPNRRASLYFRKHLSSLLDKPTFAPKLITIEDFIAGFSSLKVIDKLALIHRLYKIYNTIVTSPHAESREGESFDQFYFWGDMLLRDFDEIDKYIVNATHLFKDLSNQKELDVTFDFLTDEQKEFLKSFWINFDEKESVNKRKFLEIWRQLPDVYNAFRDQLMAEGVAYEGMLHREVAKTLTAREKSAASTGAVKYLFVGFNALTKAEEIIITHFISQGMATAHWDVDAYYMHNTTQEAGRFFRQYQQHDILGKTFPNDVPSYLISSQNNRAATTQLKKINLYGAAQPVGQAKLMVQVLNEKIKEGYNPEDTLIVLPDEKLLMPVLHGVAESVEKLNVTMGFPLSSTPLFNLIELLIELQLTRKEDSFNHRPVLALLGHPYIVAADAVAANNKRKEILQHNWINIPLSFLGSGVPLHHIIFRSVRTQSDVTEKQIGLIKYLTIIVETIGALQSISEFDKEYAFHFLKLLHRVGDVVHPENELVQTEKVYEDSKENRKKERTIEREKLKSFLRLFRQLIRAEKIPFRGEPLKGLQIMGVLETRNIDFKNIFILSLNEGAFPSFNSKGSYIPFNIRKAYGLPTVEYQDAIYAYLFYRVLQRAENIFLFYNSETDVLGQGEMSRYLQQLLFESGLTVNKHVLHNTIQPRDITPIVIQKDSRVWQALARHCVGHNQPKELTPTALNDYIECRLKFYFKHVANIREAREVEDDLDARVLGNFLHKVMEMLYRDIIAFKGSTTIESGDFENYEQKVNTIIDRIFITTYKLDPDKEVDYEGQRLVVREVVKRFVDRIISIDKAYAPFTLEALEKRGITYTVALDAEGQPNVVLGGIVDRADKKGNVIRVIDYKTGKDELSFESISSLFNREGRRNKAAFQTMLYALIYKKNIHPSPGTKLIPGLMNRVNLFDDNFAFGLKTGRTLLDDATPLFPLFEEELKKLLEELYDPAVPFDQTGETEVCSYCPYHGMCYR